MKEYKRREAQRIKRKARQVGKKLPWRQACDILTTALAQAIWHEGGSRDDAHATAEIVFYTLNEQLDRMYGDEKVIPLRRKASYFK